MYIFRPPIVLNTSDHHIHHHVLPMVSLIRDVMLPETDRVCTRSQHDRVRKQRRPQLGETRRHIIQTNRVVIGIDYGTTYSGISYEAVPAPDEDRQYRPPSNEDAQCWSHFDAAFAVPTQTQIQTWFDQDLKII